MSATSAILLTRCRDRPGIVFRLSELLHANGGNILHADQHIDVESDQFLGRLEWDLAGFALDRDAIPASLRPIAADFGMDWALHFSDARPRVAIFVSKLDHCLVDLLHRAEIGELAGEIALVVSNHPTLRGIVEARGIPFHVLPVTPDTKAAQEARAIGLLEEAGVELIVLARYMQILTEPFVERFAGRIVNIHHSFLPAFVGANPYARAHERGVKLIGATSHYVTRDLDEGPIIEQDVARVNHRDAVEDLMRKGRDLERVVLARAVRLHLERRVLAYGNRTVVFG